MSNTPNKLLFPGLAPFYDAATPVAELIMRVLAGVMMVWLHGWAKIQAPTASGEMLGMIGFGAPMFWSVVLSLFEFFAGLMLIFGFYTRFAAASLGILIAVTIYAHWVVFGEGFVGAERPILWGAILLFFAVRGGGKYSVDAKLSKTL